MTEQTTANASGADEAPAVMDTNLTFTVPNTGDPAQSVSVDLATVPAAARLEMLKAEFQRRVLNRVNVANVRYNKANAPFAKYAEDPLANPKPEGTAPEKPDLIKLANEAIAELQSGQLRTRSASGEGRKRKTVDPLEKAVTRVVVDTVFAATKAQNDKFTYPMAVKAVSDAGGGMAYLNAQIDARVAAAPEGERDELRKQLTASTEARFIQPQRIALGLDTPKGKAGSLPSLF